MTNTGGRPKLYDSPEQLQADIEEYFTQCDNRLLQGYDDKTNTQFAYISPEPYTMSGLAFALGMDRRSLLNYSKDDRFFPAIKAARNRVESDVERRLMEGKATTGAIFNLKNNFDWKDETKTDVTTGGEKLEGLVVIKSGS